MFSATYDYVVDVYPMATTINLGAMEPPNFWIMDTKL